MLVHKIAIHRGKNNEKPRNGRAELGPAAGDFDKEWHQDGCKAVRSCSDVDVSTWVFCDDLPGPGLTSSAK